MKRTLRTTIALMMTAAWLGAFGAVSAAPSSCAKMSATAMACDCGCCGVAAPTRHGSCGALSACQSQANAMIPERALSFSPVLSFTTESSVAPGSDAASSKAGWIARSPIGPPDQALFALPSGLSPPTLA